jgi:hypothetical protein
MTPTTPITATFARELVRTDVSSSFVEPLEAIDDVRVDVTNPCTGSVLLDALR